MEVFLSLEEQLFSEKNAGTKGLLEEKLIPNVVHFSWPLPTSIATWVGATAVKLATCQEPALELLKPPEDGDQEQTRTFLLSGDPTVYKLDTCEKLQTPLQLWHSAEITERHFSSR